jgi:hypothetical protein
MTKEFNIMRTKFSPQFVQRIEKTMQNLSTVTYDIEVIKMAQTQAASKKDVSEVEFRLKNYTPAS